MSHWYAQNGDSKFEIPMAKDPTKMRDTTLRDARKPENQWLASVTTITKEMVAKEAIVIYRVGMMKMAAMTMPRAEWDSYTADELSKKLDKDAEEHSLIARTFGSALHDAIEHFVMSGEVTENPKLIPFFLEFKKWWDENVQDPIVSEKVLIGDGYAGRVDLIAKMKDGRTMLVDFKTRKRSAPKTKAEVAAGLGKFGQYGEDNYQLAAYRLAAHRDLGMIVDGVANLFIDNINPTVCVFEEKKEDLMERFAKAWMFKVKDWQWKHNYFPQQAVV